MYEYSPIVKLRNPAKDVNLFIKREDLIPFSFGGNKVRIASEYYADMDVQGCNCMIGYGNARSNLCRVFANLTFSQKEKKVCHIISPSEEDGSRIETANSKIVKSCGVILHPCNKNSVADSVEAVIEECKEKGFKPYYMYGDKFGKGNEAVPVRAYVKVYSEIYNQAKRLGVKFDYIFLANGTGMTQAGLIAGRQIQSGTERIIGISVARKREQELKILQNYIESYFKSENLLLKIEQIEVVDDYLCGGYGKYCDDIKSTIKNLFFSEGIPLDSTYTGKAFYGMLNIIQKEKLKGNVLFIHTGGTPLFFDNIEILTK